MHWMILPLKRYAEFSGRSRRQEYWMFFLFQFLINMVLGVIEMIVLGTPDPSSTASDMSPVTIFSWLVYLALFIPNLAVTVRRLHDTDRTGWWLLASFGTWVLVGFAALNAFFGSGEDFNFAQIAGPFIIAFLLAGIVGIVLFVFLCLDGTQGPNRFGPDPKGRDYSETFA